MVNFAILSPLQGIYLYKAKRPDGIATIHLRDIILGGGSISLQHMQEIREIFPGTHVSLCYGQTEMSGFALLFSPNQREHILSMYDKPTSSGTAVIGVMCKVVDPNSEESLGPYKQGELLIKSNSLMNGYYNMDSSSAWDNEGWLKSGDIAYYDEEKFFYIVDRLKEMLKFQGFHVSPAALEAILLTHPSVASAVVVGVPHDVDGDHPLGVVVLKDANDSITAQEIEQYVEKRVSDRQKLRGGVKFIDKIPLTPSGKIKRLEITKLAREGLL